MYPIRILHVVQRMEAAGLQNFIMNIYRNIDRSQVQFDFLTHYREKHFFDDEIESLGGRIYRLSVREDFCFLKYYRDLSKFFRIHKEYKVIHGHMESLGAIYLRAARKQGVSVRIAHIHTASHATTIKGCLRGIMAKAFQKNATLLFACSELAGHYAFAKSPFKVYRNAIDVSKYRFDPDIREIVRSELSLHGKFVVGHVGRFNSVKNHIFLLEVFHHVIKKNPNSILVLIGTGPLTKKIAERINVMKMTSQVLMLGARSDVERLYQGMDVFVLPSLFEGFPVVAVEAQAAGLMTICATNITNEVQLTDLCHEFPLSKATEAWAEYILLNAGSYVRQEKVKEIARAGYDSKQATLDLQKKYLELHALNP